MLQQNWFLQNNMVMFRQWYDEQWFYDMNNECIYIVGETDNKRIYIEQFEPTDYDYNLYYKDYEDYKNYLKARE